MSKNSLDENKPREQLIDELNSLRIQLTDKQCLAGKFYRITLDALPANIAILGDSGDIILVNQAWREFAEQNGASAEMVSEGKNYLEICDEASGNYSKEAKYFAKAIRMVMSGKKSSYAREYPCHSPDKKRWFLGNIAPFPDDGCHVMVVHVNITELKAARQGLQKATKTLEQRVTERTKQVEARTRQLQLLSVELIEVEERERRRFAELLHDDLQQVLASARMQLQSLSQKMVDEPTLAYVEQLLEESIAKSRSLSYELSPPVLHRSDLVTALQWLVRQKNEQFGLQVHLKADSAEAFEIAPIKVFIFRALQELLTNVAKHAGVKSAKATLTWRDGKCSLTVSDQGRGFDTAILDSSSPTTSGFGLLSLKERTSYMGGSFIIDSAPGQGCCSTLKIPLNLTTSDMDDAISSIDQSGFPKDDASSATKGIRVLFADDHLAMRQGLIRLITGRPDIRLAGEAANGREAIEQALELRPDVIIMDINMPEIDGIEATRRIIAELPDVRIIGLSVHNDEQLATKMRKAGAKAFIGKTASLTELLKAIYGIRWPQEGTIAG